MASIEIDTLIDSYLATAGEALGVLSGAQTAAREFLVANKLPGRKDERYKYTDITSAFESKPQPVLKPFKVSFDLNEIFRCDIPNLDTHILVLVNGFFHSFIPKGELPKGLTVKSMATAIAADPAIEDKFLKHKKSPEDSLEALNTLFAKDGYFIHIERDTILDKPIQIVNIPLESDGALLQSQNLIVAEEGSHAGLVICDHTVTPGVFVNNTSLTAIVNEHAELDIVQMQNEHDEATHINHTYIRQQASSVVKHICLSLHGGLIRNNLRADLLGENAENHTYGLFFTDLKQHVDNYTFINHAVPNCSSNQLYKGILDNESVGAFTGRIYVDKVAQKTQAYQRNNNLLLSSSAKMNSRPQLEIYADDVKCSHGATVGQLNEDSLFYLRARGIGLAEARILLMYAFAYEILNAVTVAPLRERIGDLVDRRLRGELARCHNCAIYKKK